MRNAECGMRNEDRLKPELRTGECGMWAAAMADFGVRWRWRTGTSAVPGNTDRLKAELRTEECGNAKTSAQPSAIRTNLQVCLSPRPLPASALESSGGPVI